MTERTAGPVFKIGGNYLRTMIEADGLRTVHPGDLKAAFPPDGPKPSGQDPEVQKWLAWMRAGTKPQSREIIVRKIPFHTRKLQITTPQACVGLMLGDAVAMYCNLFDVLRAFGLSADEGREYVEAGALVLSAERQPCPLEEMKVSRDDLTAFMEKTGCSFASDVRH